MGHRARAKPEGDSEAHDLHYLRCTPINKFPKVGHASVLSSALPVGGGSSGCFFVFVCLFGKVLSRERRSLFGDGLKPRDLL